MGSHKVDSINNNKRTERLSSFIKGLGFFLHRDKDKAVDEFINFYNGENNLTFEESIALGALLRQRGEIDRAIKFHKTVISDTSIEPSQRSLALFELAKDFRRVGLLDKAEEILYELLKYNFDKSLVVEMLVKIYQQEKEWNKALVVIEKFGQFLSDDYKKVEAQYYCELGKTAFNIQDFDNAIIFFKKAIHVDVKCVRALLNLGKLSVELKKYNQAIEYFDKLSEANPEMISLTLTPFNKCFSEDKSDLSKKLEILKRWHEKNKNPNIVLSISDLLEKTESVQVALDFLLKELKDEPSYDLFSKIFKYRINEISEKDREKFIVLSDLVDVYKAKSSRYICEHCGFKSNILFWQCPGCHCWDTMKPSVYLRR
ncbi:MAG: tetratricopeptide repeat protein [Succinivibrionaceae bacterium]